MNTLNKEKALELIKNSNGKAFSVVFTKKDGTKRHMNCRTGVKKGVKGNQMSWDAESKGYVKVYDMQNKGHRLVNLNTLELIRINKTEYIVSDKLPQKKTLWQSVVSFFGGN